MNRKQLILLLIILAVVGGAGWLVSRNGGGSSSGAGEMTGRKLLGDKFPVNDVAHISIKQGTNALNLFKKETGWQVRERNDYPANFTTISEFLIKAADLKVVQAEQVGASQLGRFNLATGQGANSGTTVDLRDKTDKIIQTFTAGKAHLRKPSGQQRSPFGDSDGFPDGRYVMVAGSQDVLLVGDPLENIEPKPGPWLSKEFFKVERPKAVAVAFPMASNSWKLSRATETNEWTLANTNKDEVLDTNKIYAVVTPFAAPSFSDVATGKPEELGLDKPTIVTVETFEDFTYTVKVGTRTVEEYPITIAVAANLPKERVIPADEKPEDKEKAEKDWKDKQTQLADKLKQAKRFENWTYMIPVYSVEPLLKERKDLLEEKKEEVKVDGAAAEKKDEPISGDK